MSTIKRCDNCKELSDKDGIGYIGKEWILKAYKETIATIKTQLDLCKNCLRQKVADNYLSEDNND